MKILRIAAHRVELPLHEGSYRWSGGKSVSVFDSTVVCVETDEGVTGCRQKHGSPSLSGFTAWDALAWDRPSPWARPSPRRSFP